MAEAAWWKDASDRESVAQDVAKARGMTAADHDRILCELCETAAEFVSQHPDPRRTLAWQDPVPASTRRLLAEARARFRRGG